MQELEREKVVIQQILTVGMSKKVFEQSEGMGTDGEMVKIESKSLGRGNMASPIFATEMGERMCREGTGLGYWCIR